MLIYYNFMLESKVNSDFNPWLVNLFGLVCDKSRDIGFKLRASLERKGVNRFYRLDNKKNKTYAVVYLRVNTLYLSLYKRELPDMSKHIKPPDVLVKEITAPDTDTGMKIISDAIIEVLGAENEYSTNTVNKVKVCAGYVEGKEGKLIGGLISETYDSGDKKIITIDNGLSFIVDAAEATIKRAMARKYIVLDDKLNFEILVTNSFDHYYELV